MAVELNATTTNKWSETDASNTASPPDGAPAGMFPNQSEGVWRGTMATVQRFWNRINGAITSTGSSNAYVYTPANTSYPTAYVQGEIYSFKANFANTGAATLNINSLGAKNIYKKGTSGAVALVGGEIQSGDLISVAYDGTQFQILSDTPVATVTKFTPTITVYTSGTGTFSLPAGASNLSVRLVGGGGGGGGSGSGGGTGGTGGTTSFGAAASATGGVGGVNSGAGGVGGAGSSGSINLNGGSGGNANATGAALTINGGLGGSSAFGGGGLGGYQNIAGSPGAANTGGGGGGGAANGSVTTGAGGGAGGYSEVLITSPAGTYSYAVGAGGSAGTAGGSGFVGGAGGSGIIIVVAT